ncbi:MAG TPA: hypothetical protein VJM83_06630 [Nitrospirota bacterium]|nr:hypothetical protein [Nitrospirota bacterium]
MDAHDGLTLTVRIDTTQARQEVAEFRRYALQALDEIRAAYASLGPVAAPETPDGGPLSGGRA